MTLVQSLRIVCETILCKRQNKRHPANMTVTRYLRFLDQSNEDCYGEVSDELVARNLIGSEVPVLTGHPFEGLTTTGRKAIVQKVVFQC